MGCPNMFVGESMSQPIAAGFWPQRWFMKATLPDITDLILWWFYKGTKRFPHGSWCFGPLAKHAKIGEMEGISETEWNQKNDFKEGKKTHESIFDCWFQHILSFHPQKRYDGPDLCWCYPQCLSSLFTPMNVTILSSIVWACVFFSELVGCQNWKAFFYW